MNTSTIISRVWSFCTTLRDDEIHKITWENACRFFDWDPFAHIARDVLRGYPALRVRARGYALQAAGVALVEPRRYRHLLRSIEVSWAQANAIRT